MNVANISQADAGITGKASLLKNVSITITAIAVSHVYISKSLNYHKKLDIQDVQLYILCIAALLHRTTIIL